MKWEAVGLDLEVDFREVAPMAEGNLTPFITAATNRLINPQQLAEAKAAVSKFVFGGLWFVNNLER